MSEPVVNVRREGRACVLELNRPAKLNAISSAVEEALLAALASEEVRSSACVVLAGAGRAFSAGADRTEFAEDAAAALRYYARTGDVFERVAAQPVPTIAAIHGWCLGGAFELALAADFRVADATATFGLPEVEIGILPSSGGLHRLVRLVGAGRAKELMLLRGRFGAEEARSLGLVTEVVAEGAALARALELAEQLAALPPLAVEVTKAVTDRAAESSREAAILLERLAYAALAGTEDAVEAGRAFVEKREPRFSGR